MPQVSLTRIYHFSSAHRLHSQHLDADENRYIYDKCNNYNGHGHDYKVEVSVKGIPHKVTGMILPLPEMDSKVRQALNTLEHKHLDKEVPFFSEEISTAENIIRYLWDKIDANLPAGLLYHIKIWETNNNYFEFGKEQQP